MTTDIERLKRSIFDDCERYGHVTLSSHLARELLDHIPNERKEDDQQAIMSMLGASQRNSQRITAYAHHLEQEFRRLALIVDEEYDGLGIDAVNQALEEMRAEHNIPNEWMEDTP